MIRRIIFLLSFKNSSLLLILIFFLRNFLSSFFSYLVLSFLYIRRRKRMHLGQLFFFSPSVELFLSYDNAIIFLGVEFALRTRMQLSATSILVRATCDTKRLNEHGTRKNLHKSCILALSFPMTHDHRTVLEVHGIPYTVISPTFHVAHTYNPYVTAKQLFLYTSIFNFFRPFLISARLIDYKLYPRLGGILGFFSFGNDRNSLTYISPAPTVSPGREIIHPTLHRSIEISTHTVQLELAFLLCDLTLRTTVETRAHVHTGEVKGRVVTQIYLHRCTVLPWFTVLCMIRY